MPLKHSTSEGRTNMPTLDDRVDQEWRSLLKAWRAADERVRVPDAPITEIVAGSASSVQFTSAIAWLGVAAIIAIAVTFVVGMRNMDQQIQSERIATIVPSLASGSEEQGLCGSFTSCLDPTSFLERVKLY